MPDNNSKPTGFLAPLANPGTDMNGPINIDYTWDTPTVSGRELHIALQIKTAYKDWFPRMCGYGFTEGTDFNPLNFEQVRSEGGRRVTRSILPLIEQADEGGEKDA